MADWFGIAEAAVGHGNVGGAGQNSPSSEPRHDIEPTAKHVANGINRMKSENCELIVREPRFSERVPNQIASQTGVKVVKLATMVGGVPEAATYIDMIDYNVRTLCAAAKEAGAIAP